MSSSNDNTEQLADVASVIKDKSFARRFSFYAEQIFLLLFWRRLRNIPMLLLIGLLFTMMAALPPLAGLGAPYLFWADNSWTIALAMLGVGLFLEEWVFVAFLLDTDRENPSNRALHRPGQTETDCVVDPASDSGARNGNDDAAANDERYSKIETDLLEFYFSTEEDQESSDMRTAYQRVRNSNNGEEGKEKIKKIVFNLGRMIHTRATYFLCLVFAPLTLLCFINNTGAIWSPWAWLLPVVLPPLGAYIVFQVRRTIMENRHDVRGWVSKRLDSIPLIGKSLSRVFEGVFLFFSRIFQFFKGKFSGRERVQRPGLLRAFQWAWQKSVQVTNVLTNQREQGEDDDESTSEDDETELVDYGSFEEFHNLGLFKNAIVFLVLAGFAILYWKGYWLYESTFSTVSLMLCTLLALTTGIYGVIIFQRRRQTYEFVVFSFFLVCGLAYLFFSNIPQQVQLETSQFPDSPNGALIEVSEVLKAQYKQRNAIRLIAEAGQATHPPSPPSPPDPALVKVAERQDQEGWQLEKESLSNWKKKIHGDEKPILVLIANTGGGIKAQVWSTVVLHALEQQIAKLGGRDQPIHFSQNVRVITGASGGMVGAAYWAATVPSPKTLRQLESETQALPIHVEYKWPEGKIDDQTNWETDTWESISVTESLSRMAADCLSPVGRQYFYNDLLGFPLNLAGFDLDKRGRALEDALARHGPAFKRPMSSFRRGEIEGWRPVMAFSPTVCEDGRRFIISNQPIEYAFSGHLDLSDNTLGERDVLDVDSTTTYSWRVNYPQSNMTLATAARLNANFPGLADSPFLPFQCDKKRLHLMDGGYIDNHGMFLVGNWLYDNRRWVVDNTSGVLVVEICASHLERNDVLNENGAGFPEGAGFVAASFNKTFFHSDKVLSRFEEYVTNEWSERNGPDKNNPVDQGDSFLKVVTFGYEGDAALTWYLSNTEKFSLVYPFLTDEQLERIKNGESIKGASDYILPFDSDSSRFTQDVLKGKGPPFLNWLDRLLDQNNKNPTAQTKRAERLTESRSRFRTKLNQLSDWWREHDPRF